MAETKRTLTVEMAKKAGFDNAAYAEIANIDFSKEVGDLCELDSCGKYNKCWACPPVAGNFESISEKVQTYDYALILQTVGYKEDDYDWDTIQATNKRCTDNLLVLAKELRDMGKDIIAMGACGCKLCPKCSYPDEPCRFPDEKLLSLEAAGFFVTREIEKVGLKFIYEPLSTTMSAAIFVKE